MTRIGRQSAFACLGLALLVVVAIGDAHSDTAAKPRALRNAARVFGPPADQPVKLGTASGVIYGSLTLPREANALKTMPVVAIIAGSGPVDRDGNVVGLAGGNDSVKLLAHGLARRGIAALRYDKRGVGASSRASGREFELRIDGYVDDAIGWLKWLRKDKRFSTVVALGHSEGSLIAMLALERGPANALISIAGAARRASDIMREQLNDKLDAETAKKSNAILSGLEVGSPTAEVPAELMVLYRPSIQPYLMSWFAHTPLQVLPRVGVPVMIIHGSTDAQIGVAEARALGQVKPDAQLAIIDGMNHVLKIVPDDPHLQQASYFDPQLPIAPELFERLWRFIVGLRR